LTRARFPQPQAVGLPEDLRAEVAAGAPQVHLRAGPPRPASSGSSASTAPTRLAGATRGVGGNGLGLSICQALFSAHESRIVVRSRLGECTTVNVTLPTLAATAAAGNLTKL
jgi:hypothetical protein